MEILWSPWRSKYIETFKDEEKKCNEECFLCLAANSPDRDKELLVAARFEKCFAILNKFPYNNGHTLIAPYRHIGDLEELDDEELIGIMKAVRQTIKALTISCGPHAYNIGANLGRTAGAGLPGHLHFHVIPRWDGDTSFLTIVSDTKVVSISLEDSLEQISKAFRQLETIKD